MSIVVQDNLSTGVGQIKDTRRQFLLRRGVFLTPYHNAAVWAVLDWATPVGVFGIVLHPAVASMFGAQISKIFAVVAIALLLPACRKIVIAPFTAIVIACLAIGAYNKSIDAVIVALPTYAIFHLLAYETQRFLRMVLVIGAIAALLALLQFLIPSPYLNIHATAESLNNFLDQYRPTSIFPTQAYYNQFLLLLIPIFFLAGERRIGVFALAGFSALITGATAGLLFVVLALALGTRHIVRYLIAGVGLALAIMAVAYPERLAYNFSLGDMVLSVTSRIFGAPADMKDVVAPIAAAIAAGHPSLLIAVQVTAIGGLLLVSMMAVRMTIPFSRLLPTSVSAIAIVAGQLIHSTIGSLYFSMTLAVLTALIWNFLTAFNKSIATE